MDESETVTKLLIELGDLDSRIDTILQSGPRLWLLSREDITIELELDIDAIRLMLSSDLGVPAPNRAAAVHATALSYGLLWQQTGGFRLALSTDAGALFLMVDVLLPELEAASLATAIGNFAQKVSLWRRFIAGEFETMDTSAQDGLDMIRV